MKTKSTPKKPPTVKALTIERKAIKDLKPHPRNPRIHPEAGTPEWEALKASLAHDYFDPIVWNKRNGMLVSGHLRRKVMEAEGVTHADVVVVDYDEATHIARMIAANRLQGRDDFATLKDLLVELDSGAFDMQLTGYDNLSLEELLVERGVTDGFKRPGFKGEGDAGEQAKDGNWLYVEFYKQDERFKDLVVALTAMGAMKSEHQLDPDFFERMVTEHGNGK